MRSISRIAASRPSQAALCAALLIAGVQAQTPRQLSVRHVQVLGGRNAVEIEIEASDRIVPQAQVLTNPDRLVIDFPNAVPGSELHSQSVYRGQVKDLRVGLFQSKPPVTRIVLDLNSAQSYQIFPGQTVIIKVMNSPDMIPAVADYPEPTGRPGLITANYVASAERIHVNPTPAPKPLEVDFRDGLLTVHSNKATLSEVLYAVQQRTGAEVAIAAGAEQEKVVVDLGPAPAPEVLAQLLNGSKFNFLILSNANDPHQLDKVILSQRVEGYTPPPPPPMAMPGDTADDEQPVPPPRPAPIQQAPARMQGPGQQPPEANVGDTPQ
jgi:hypothetical protein